MSEKLSPERAIRLLRAKAAELENQVKADIGAGGMAAPHRSVEQQRINYLAADIALVAGLLADFMERLDVEGNAADHG